MLLLQHPHLVRKGLPVAASSSLPARTPGGRRSAFLLLNVGRNKFVMPQPPPTAPLLRLNRSFSESPSPPTGSAEERLIAQLCRRFPGATNVAVVDVSGGCGAMYEVYVEAPQFAGLRLVRQHQLVTEALKEEIADMHGLRISTAVSPGPASADGDKSGGGG